MNHELAPVEEIPLPSVRRRRVEPDVADASHLVDATRPEASADASVGRAARVEQEPHASELLDATRASAELDASAGDELLDLYPGSGGVLRAWRSATTSRHFLAPTQPEQP